VFFKLSTFSPANITEIYNVLDIGYNDSIARGSKKINCDVTGNGGGIICYGFLLNALLVKDWLYGNLNHSTSTYGLYDFKISPIIDNIIAANITLSSIIPANRINVNTKLTETDYSYYNNKTLKNRGGKNSYYSQKDYFPNCNDILAKAPPQNYYFDEIVVISDGACGSTCAAFITQLSYYGNCKVMTHGGIVGYDMDISSFAGGNVLEWVAFASDTNNTSIVTPLTNTGRARFNFNEAYLGNLDTPKEFMNYRGDYHTYMWDAVFSSNYTNSLKNVERLYATAYTIFSPNSSVPNNNPTLIIIIVASIAGVLILTIGCIVIFRYYKKRDNSRYNLISQ